ncbi:MAG: hypothetical protein RMI94_00830 [Bryobacterales bacterium]|nr:hypothetical protein [Bryobacteraceae bacterium]MDW8129065.1 hypothetical protein [Bryobacterales bacterium]
MFRLPALLVASLLLPAQRPATRPAAPKPVAPAERLGAAAQRNENIQVHRIDNDAIKEANIRLGTNVTPVTEAPSESSYFAAEHGRPPVRPPLLGSRVLLNRWRGELFEWHQNSVFNARTFFQVGPVQPSLRNHYGLRATGGAGRAGNLSLAASQRKIRGMVNGNVLVPLPEERTPLATDPAVRALISRWLDAYPPIAPNRPDFDPRALNTNAPQQVDETDLEARLDRDLGARSRLAISHALSRQRERAFQLVAGQNPDTDIHSHRSRLTWRRSFSETTELAAGLGFDRVRSWLRPEPRAVGPRVRIGFQIEELGPDSMFPIDRAENNWRAALLVSRQARGGRHRLSWGGDLTRLQLNGVESNNQRGYFQFTNNFGRTAVENFRLGAPTTYEVTIGELARGFRQWKFNGFFGDRWSVTPRFQVHLGLRYNAQTTPVEVRRLDIIPYGCDCNNFSPRLGIAWGFGGWTLRAAYSVSFGEILPVTFQQVRNNLPHVRYVQVQNPDVLDPLRGLRWESGADRSSPTWLSPDLVSPYAHQYSLTLERPLVGGIVARAGYVGSRTFKLLNSFIQNRAEPVPGIPLTTATVDERRPDPRYYELKRIVNAGIAYLDAAQFGLDLPARRGLLAGVRYTFSKAIDEGADYASTAANTDILRGRSQWQYDQLRDRKGLSNFDAPHALELHAVWELPSGASRSSFRGRLLRGWQVSTALLVKSGTPFTLYVGSDAPGYGNVDGGPGDRPHILDPSILGRTVDDPNTSTSILRRDRFAFIRPGERRGNLGRNTFRKDGIANVNAALSKQWSLGSNGERLLVFRAEAYNLCNHPQFDEPQRNLSSPSFGRITNTLNYGRVLQLGLRLLL